MCGGFFNGRLRFISRSIVFIVFSVGSVGLNKLVVLVVCENDCCYEVWCIVVRCDLLLCYRCDRIDNELEFLSIIIK